MSRAFETEPESARLDVARDTVSCLGFVVLWDAYARDRLGAWLPLPPDSQTPHMFGRGPREPDDEHPRLEPVRQRPGDNTLLAPFENPALSRKQLLVRKKGAASLFLENVGRCRTSLNGREFTQAEARPNDVLEMGNQLVLYCTERPLTLAGPRMPASSPFGLPHAHGFVGESPAAWRLAAEVLLTAPRGGHALVLGATGTGKELVSG